MIIMQINADWNQGGPGTIEKDIHDTLISSGHKCMIAYGRGKCPVEIESIKVGKDIDVILHMLMSRLFDNEGGYSRRATKRFVETIKVIRPDIIQLHNLLGHYLNHEILFQYLKTSGIPVVWTLHDCSPFTGHCINFDRVLCDRWKKQCGNCPLTKDYPYSYFIDKSKDNYNHRKRLYGNMNNLHIVVPSKWMGNIVKESFLQKRDIYVFHNGINLEKFRPIPNNLREEYDLGEKIILVAAAYKWNEMKGFNILMQLERMLDDKYALVIIGNKEESAVGNRAISVPVVTDVEELIKWYTVADIFINPTLGDNFPTVNIEALACGTPIVTCDTGGSPEIADNICGRIVYSKTAEEFVEKIDECYAANISIEECRTRAKLFDRKICYQKYIDLYTELIG